MQQFIVTIEGPNFSDFEEIELPRLPADGDPIDTEYGVCVVTATEHLSDDNRFDGKIVCRFP